MKIDSFKEKLGSWLDLLTPFIISEKCDKIYQKLKEDAKKEVIFPLSSDTFKAFKECNINNLKLVVLGLEPYSNYYWNKDPKINISQADGIAMSCENGKIQPSLEYFLRGIALEYNLPYEDYYETNSLKYLCEQGVLLVNRSLTVKKNKITSHIGLWDEFWEYFFQELQSKCPNIPILFLGKEAEYLRRYIFEMANPVFVLSHPSAAARTHEDWDTKKVFEKIASLNRTHQNDTITWSYKLYEEKVQKLKALEDKKDKITQKEYNYEKMIINNSNDNLLPF